MIYLKTKIVSVDLSSRYFTEEDLVWDLESKHSLEDPSELETHISACHTSSVSITLFNGENRVPNFVVNEVTGSSLEETFGWVVEKSVEEITHA